MSQKIVSNIPYEFIGKILEGFGCKKFMLVCGNSLSKMELGEYLESLEIPHVTFKGFSPNPKYEEICPAVKLFLEEGCDLILAVGGGSAIDVAKCVIK